MQEIHIVIKKNFGNHLKSERCEIKRERPITSQFTQTHRGEKADRPILNYQLQRRCVEK
jgi:hypothetical protein